MLVENGNIGTPMCLAALWRAFITSCLCLTFGLGPTKAAIGTVACE